MPTRRCLLAEAEIGDTLRQVRQDTGSKALWLQHDGEGEGSYEAFIAAARPPIPVWPSTSRPPSS